MTIRVSRLPLSGWDRALALLLVVLALRLVYLVGYCPFELAADETHYWEWSRRLDMSYYTKGPGVAWIIAASTRAFGDTPWAIRLPAALSVAVAALALGRLAFRTRPKGGEAAWYTVALFCLVPLFHGLGQFMTIDAPYLACWSLACLGGWAWMQARREGKAGLVPALGLGTALGIGFLFKYTILLLIPGLWLARAWERRALRHAGAGSVSAPPPAAAVRWATGVGCVLAFALAISPVLLWNHAHGWPTVSHVLGHASLPGGDIAARQGWNYNPLWTLGYLAHPLVVLGPPIAWLAALSVVRAWRTTRTVSGAGSAARYLLSCSIPILVFYLIVSFTTDLELNWPAAGHATILVLAGHTLADDDRRQRLWRWCLGVGVAAALTLSFAPPVLRGLRPILPAPAAAAADRGLARISAHQTLAEAVEAEVHDLQAATGRKPLLIAKSYGDASLLAFYLPGHPVTYCANYWFGGRHTAYDYFADTSLTDPNLKGRPAVMVGGMAEVWRIVFRFDSLEQSRRHARVMTATGYQLPEKPFGK